MGFVSRIFGWGKEQAVVPPVRPVASPATAALGTLAKPENKATGRIAEEMRGDYQVQFAETIIRSVAKTIPVMVTHDAPGDARADALARQLTELFQRTLDTMFDAIGDGRVAFEKCWEYDPKNRLTICEKLEPLPYDRTEMKLSPVGEYAGLTLKPKGADPVSIDPECSWWLALKPTAMEPHGRSGYMGAPHDTWSKRQSTLKLRDIFIRRFVIGGGTAWVPQTYVDPDTQQIVNNIEKFGQAIAVRESGGWLICPNGKDADGNKDYEVENPTSVDPTPISGIIEAQEVEQLRSFGMPEDALQESSGQAGSYAKTSIRVLMMYAVIEGYLDDFTKSFNRYVASKSAEKNYADPATRPTFKSTFKRITDAILAEQLAAAAERPAPQLGGDGKPVAGDAAGGVDTVAETAMNGAQVTSMQGIIAAVSAGEMPVESAEGIINAAFPALSDQQVAAIIGPLKKMAPAGVLGQPSASGEFKDVTRQQLIRNRKAIDDILSKLKSGEYDQKRARVELGMLGLEPKTIDGYLDNDPNTPIEEPQ